MLRVPVNSKVKKLLILLQALPSPLELVCSCIGPSRPWAPAFSPDTHQVRLPVSPSPPSASQATRLSLFLLCTSPASGRPIFGSHQSLRSTCSMSYYKASDRPTLTSPGTICFLQLPALSWAHRIAQHPCTYLILTPCTIPTIAISNTDSLQVLSTPTCQPTVLLDPWLSPIFLSPTLKNNIIILYFFCYSHLCGINQSYSQAVPEPSSPFMVFLPIPVT